MVLHCKISSRLSAAGCVGWCPMAGCCCPRCREVPLQSSRLRLTPACRFRTPDLARQFRAQELSNSLYVSESLGRLHS